MKYAIAGGVLGAGIGLYLYIRYRSEYEVEKAKREDLERKLQAKSANANEDTNAAELEEDKNADQSPTSKNVDRSVPAARRGSQLSDTGMNALASMSPDERRKLLFNTYSNSHTPEPVDEVTSKIDVEAMSPMHRQQAGVVQRAVTGAPPNSPFY